MSNEVAIYITLCLGGLGILVGIFALVADTIVHRRNIKESKMWLETFRKIEAEKEKECAKKARAVGL